LIKYFHVFLFNYLTALHPTVVHSLGSMLPFAMPTPINNTNTENNTTIKNVNKLFI